MTSGWIVGVLHYLKEEYGSSTRVVRMWFSQNCAYVELENGQVLNLRA